MSSCSEAPHHGVVDDRVALALASMYHCYPPAAGPMVRYIYINIFSNVSCCIFRCRVPCWIILSRLLCSLGNRQKWQGWKTRSREWLSGGLGWWFGIPGMPRNDFFSKAPCIPWLIYSTLHPKNLHKGTQSPVRRPLFPIFSKPFLPLSWRPKAVPGQNWCYQCRPTPAQWVKSWKYHMDPQTAGRLTRNHLFMGISNLGSYCQITIIISWKTHLFLLLPS